MAKGSFNNVGIVGWAATTASVVAYDAWAIKTGRPTMSRTLGHYLAHPIAGPILAGVWMGLSYHLLVEELLPAFMADRIRRPDFVLGKTQGHSRY